MPRDSNGPQNLCKRPYPGRAAGQKIRRDLAEFAREYDVHAMTPREMVDLSFDLYFAGILDREQYADLAFQSELMPNFDLTIGALTGEKAAPDRPRDYAEIWKQRLRFEMTHLPDDPRIIERTKKIFDLLRSFDKENRLPAVIEDFGYPEFSHTADPDWPIPEPEPYHPPAFKPVDLPPLSLKGLNKSRR